MNHREIDALVAEKVMGFENVERTNNTDFDQFITLKVCNGIRFGENVPYYSTNISDAWQVVEQMRKQKLFIDIRPCDDFYEAWIDDDPISTCQTAPLAICKATLKSIGVDVEE